MGTDGPEQDGWKEKVSNLTSGQKALIAVVALFLLPFAILLIPLLIGLAIFAAIAYGTYRLISKIPNPKARYAAWGFVGLIVLIGMFNGASEERRKQQQAPTVATAVATETPAPIQEQRPAEISWAEIYSHYGTGSQTTDVQKEEFWKARYKGRHVRWRGQVSDVEKGAVYGGWLNVRMVPDTITYDVRVGLDTDTMKKAFRLHKDDFVTYEGTLDKYDSGLLNVIVVDDGKIVADNQ